MKFLSLNGVSILWRRIKETFARKSEAVTSISRNDTIFTATKADGSQFQFDQKDTTYDVATATVDGLMSADDKHKLDGIESGAEVNQNAFSRVIGLTTTDEPTSEAVSDEDSDTLYLRYQSSSNENSYTHVIYDRTSSLGIGTGVSTKWIGTHTFSNELFGHGYGECDTPTDTAIKAVTLIDYAKVNGGIVAIKFTNDVGDGARLNINERGSLPIYFKGSAIKAGVIKAGDIATFVLNGIGVRASYELLAVDSSISGLEDEVAELTARLNALADSDDTTLDQLSEIVTYIKNNKSLIDGITTGKVSVDDIVDNLTSTAANKPLSAKQGKALKDMIDGIVVPTKVSQLTNDAGYLTEHQDISGKQDVITDLAAIRSGASLGATALQEETDPTVPAWAKASTKPTYTAAEVGALPDDTVIPSKVSELTNDSGYLTQHQDISGKANTADLATVATSGSYNDLSDKPTIPTVPTKVSAFTNDASYTNKKYVDDAITAALADVVGIEYHVCTTGEYDNQTYVPTLAGEAGVIYLVPKPASLIGTAQIGTAEVSGNNIYYEFIYNGRSFEMIGDTQVSLDGYLEDSDVSTDAQVQSVITEVFGGA